MKLSEFLIGLYPAGIPPEAVDHFKELEEVAAKLPSPQGSVSQRVVDFQRLPAPTPVQVAAPAAAINPKRAVVTRLLALQAGPVLLRVDGRKSQLTGRSRNPGAPFELRAENSPILDENGVRQLGEWAPWSAVHGIGGYDGPGKDFYVKYPEDEPRTPAAVTTPEDNSYTPDDVDFLVNRIQTNWESLPVLTKGLGKSQQAILSMLDEAERRGIKVLRSTKAGKTIYRVESLPRREGEELCRFNTTRVIFAGSRRQFAAGAKTSPAQVHLVKDFFTKNCATITQAAARLGLTDSQVRTRLSAVPYRAEYKDVLIWRGFKEITAADVSAGHGRPLMYYWIEAVPGVIPPRIDKPT